MNLLYSLPQELINYIYSFNVDHRIKFKNDDTCINFYKSLEDREEEILKLFKKLL